MRFRRIAIAIAILIACLIAVGRMVGLIVEGLWFASLDQAEVFWTVLTARAALFVAVFTVSAGALWLSGYLSYLYAGRGSNVVTIVDERLLRAPWFLSITSAAILLALLIAIGGTPNWDTALRFVYQVPYGKRDPVFGYDIGFYLFSLPVFVALKNGLILLIFCCAALAGVVFVVRADIVLGQGAIRFSRAAVAHASALLGIYFALKACSYWLDRFLLLYGDNDVLIGAAYTDVHVRLPILWWLGGVSAAASIASWVNVRRCSDRVMFASVLLVFGNSLVFGWVYPALFNRYYVKPSELERETPYIAHNIALAREAYGLASIEVKPFPPEQRLNVAALEANRATIDNIRLWDQRPLMDTYAQLQEIRTYYKFRSIDIDRYWLDGEYRQVMLSAREIEPSLLPESARTWVNLHLLYTHGNGVVMSPVTRKSAEGLPVFYLHDIPPVSEGGPAVREPRIYFGQAGEGYVIVKTRALEFDYPKGKDNAYTTYAGRDGIAIGSLARRALFAWRFGDPNILLTAYITHESGIVLHRNIQDRVRTIAPFLTLDHDPYIVVSNGRLVWIQDAYTTSSWFPYSPRSMEDGVNYIRNSVKVVIDAYDGTVDFYVSDPADPIIRTYGRIFPHLFKRLSSMPMDLRRHLRYPEDLFLIQMQRYRTYHMDLPEVFYNREDLWQFPRELTDIDNANASGTPMPPYYIILRMPGEPRAEFVLMLPMVPSQRENMIAWLAARCDEPAYGKLVVYTFPKDKLVYGPFQIEARIQQDTSISGQISLWNQMGSRVIRGHLVVVPIDNSILYVSPLYLRATSGQLPELKRVITAYGDSVVMQDTLSAAFAALVQDTAHVATPKQRPDNARSREALSHYDRAMERLKAGDWGGFGAEIDALRPLLEGLAGERTNK
ncbi:MAG TPA: UPF0182 family protein [Trinickia sp.]|uniref:UPF0182 family membrane protein n=1 Tax=Trinickia sp. TaxID=2571163 RepID=UPI002B996ACB|nr:UPF0182 family protein [Trinickia sp.]HTI18010.1 UPF0182 family protein [Trinickia sp.]